MFSRLAIFATLVVVPLLAAATPVARSTCAANEVPADCVSIVVATDPIAIDLLNLVDVFIGDIDAFVGVSCIPISISVRDDTPTESVCCQSLAPLNDGSGTDVGINCNAA